MSNRQIDVVQLWLKSVYRENSQSQGTIVQYDQMFHRFLEFHGFTAYEIVLDYDATDNERITRRKYGRLIRAFADELEDENLAPATVAKYIACVKSFFVHNDLPLPPMKLGRRTVMFENRDIQKDEINTILQNAKFLRDRAFFIMMAQSGLRPYELCNLKMQNIEHSLDGAKQKSYLVRIPQQIAKGKYRKFFTFIPHEAMLALRDYWNARTDLLSEDSFVFIGERGGRAHPTNGGAMSQAFKKIAERLERAGALKYEVRKGKPSQLRLYNLRKWFRKQAYQAGSDFVNFWLGHTNLDLEHYFSKDVEIHRKVYEEQALPHLMLETKSVSETSRIVAEQAEEIESLKSRLAEHKSKLEDLKALVRNLMQQMQNQRQEQETFIQRLDEKVTRVLHEKLTDEQIQAAVKALKSTQETEQTT